MVCAFVAADDVSESSDSEERKIQRRLSKQETPALVMTHMALVAAETYFVVDKTKQQRSIGNMSNNLLASLIVSSSAV